jgi:hypothetical protein
MEPPDGRDIVRRFESLFADIVLTSQAAWDTELHRGKPRRAPLTERASLATRYPQFFGASGARLLRGQSRNECRDICPLT